MQTVGIFLGAMYHDSLRQTTLSYRKGLFPQGTSGTSKSRAPSSLVEVVPRTPHAPKLARPGSADWDGIHRLGRGKVQYAGMVR